MAHPEAEAEWLCLEQGQVGGVWGSDGALPGAWSQPPLAGPSQAGTL